MVNMTQASKAAGIGISEVGLGSLIEFKIGNRGPLKALLIRVEGTEPAATGVRVDWALGLVVQS